MNAVLKHDDKDQELAVVEPKSLSELLAVGDTCPADFYNNPEYLEQVKTVKELAKSLVHTIDDQGRADSKKDAAAIRKYAKTTDSFALGVFRSMSDKFKVWRDSFTAEIKELNAIADGIDAKFKKMEQEKLESITQLLKDQLTASREESGVKSDFQVKSVDLSGMVKLSGTITDKGKLTTKAMSFIKAITDGELAHQNKTGMRLQTLENRCLRADINPPLAAINLGNELYGTDEEFDAKVDALIVAETERKTEAEARIKKQLEADNQKVLEDALADQQKAAVEIARQEQPKPLDQPEATPAADVKVSVAATERHQTTRRAVAPTDDKKTVSVIATFQISVRSHISTQAVIDHLKTKLPDDLKAALISCSGQENG
ncbi:MAG: hypothetical protein Q8L15_10770 [Methylobacter sp.]|nr:hypothetical protein [Methylobacter sp.]